MNKYVIEGFQDTNYEELRGYDIIIDTIEKKMRSYGYKQVLTPSFESYDMYNIDGTMSRNTMFKLVDNNGRVLVLRPDATLPITRMAAISNKREDEILKFGYITTIFRNVPSKTSSKKEFIQAGVEYLGNDMSDCDAEIIALAINMLQDLNFKNIHLDIGQVSFLNAIFNGVTLSKDDRNNIYKLIENKNMGELKNYLEAIDLPPIIKKTLWSIPMLFGKFDETISQAKELCLNDDMIQALEKIESTYDILKAYGLQDYIYLDLGFTNQFNYYSGLIFKGYVNDFGEAILSGGRYDDLSSTFGVNRPASGFGINISLLMDILNGSFNFDYYFDVLLLYSPKDVKQSVDISQQLRKNSISTDTIHKQYLDTINRDNYKIILQIQGNELFQILGDEINPIKLETIIDIIKEGLN